MFKRSHILLQLLCIGAAFTQVTKGDHFVDPFIPLIEFEGWGTSLAWWPDVLGAMPQDVIDNVTHAFFSEEKLAINIVRYVIGGTVPDNYTCGDYRAGAATETYLDSADSAYNWTRDARQRKILFAAKALGADTFEAFSNSPPQWMTISGCSKGNKNGGILHENFDAAQAPAFADYIAEVIEHFASEWDINFQSFAPFNEPYGLGGIGGWMGPSTTQEGCNMGRATMTETIRVLHETFARRNISALLSVADETQVDTAVGTQNYFLEHNLTNLINKVNVHGYWDTKVAKRDALSSTAAKEGHRLWMDEMGWGETPANDMGQGLEIANRMITDLRVMLPTAWVYWQVMEDVGQWGLLHVPYGNASVANIVYNNGYYVHMQFSHYIRKGYTFILVDHEHTVAAYDSKTATLVLVIVNPDANLSEELVFDLSLFSSLDSSPESLLSVRTSSSEQNAIITEAQLLADEKVLKYTPPTQSVTTIVLKNAMKDVTHSNMLTNGDFESADESWTVSGSAVVSGERARRGAWSGLIDTKDGEGVISQNVTSDASGNLYLSAWCTTTSNVLGNVRLSVDINGVEVSSVSIQTNLYKSYGLTIPSVMQGDLVTIRFQAAYDASVSHIDDVQLHANY